MKTKFKKKVISTVLTTLILLIPFFPSGNALAVSNQLATKIAERFNEEALCAFELTGCNIFFW